MTCHMLDCDRCRREFRDEDESEGRFHAPDVETIRDWARSHSWVITPAEDVCWHCAEKVGQRRHEFRSGPDQFCIWCKEWADDESHTNAPLLGQTEIFVDGGQS